MYPTAVRRIAHDLVAEGNSLNSVSKALGISRSAIRYRLERPEALDAWRAQCPAPAASSSEYSALLGFCLGDGCLSINQRSYALRIVCDATCPGIIDEVECCMLHVHPERRTYRVAAQGLIVVKSYRQHWPCLFPRHGPGRKHERSLAMTEWQWAIVEDRPGDFLRGLFHTTGAAKQIIRWARSSHPDAAGRIRGELTQRPELTVVRLRSQAQIGSSVDRLSAFGGRPERPR